MMISLRAGSSFSSFGGIKVGIAYKTEHPQFQQYNFDFDFTLLKFERPLSFDRNIQAVKLPRENEWLFGGTKCVISGYGITESNKVSDILKSVEVQIVSDEKCKSKYSKIKFPLTNRMMCAGDVNSVGQAGNKDACSGDSVTLQLNID